MEDTNRSLGWTKMRFVKDGVFVDFDGRPSKIAVVSKSGSSEGQQALSVQRPLVGSTYDPNKKSTPYLQIIAELSFPRMGDRIRDKMVTLQNPDIVCQVKDIIHERNKQGR